MNFHRMYTDGIQYKTRRTEYWFLLFFGVLFFFFLVLVWGNTGLLRRMEFFRGIASKLVFPIMEMIANALLEKLFSAKRW